MLFRSDVVLVEPGWIDDGWAEVASEAILKNSGRTAYARGAKRHAEKMVNAHQHASGPEAVAKVVHKVLKTKHPGTRYTAGKGAKTMLFGKKIMPEKTFDTVTRKVVQ